MAPSSPDSHLFLKKLASLKFTAANGLRVSVYRQTEQTGALLVLGNRQGLFSCSRSSLLFLLVSILPGCILARTNSPECPNPTIDFQNPLRLFDIEILFSI